MPQFRGGRPQHIAFQRVLRVVCAVAAVGLAVGAVWLIVTAKTTKHAQIGALLGFWSLLMAAFSGLGARGPRIGEHPATGHPATGQPGAGQPGAELDLRAAGLLERQEDAERRAAFERQLLQLVRSEIASSLGPELANIRADVAALRNEILETVGGQIRLERIETTRMIGSDLEALQRELRSLRAVSADLPAPQPAPPPRPAVAYPAVDVPAQPAQPPAPAHSDTTYSGAAPYDDYADDDYDDPFALLPRVTPYADDEVDTEYHDEHRAQPVQVYAGRRRAREDDDEPTGRHSAGHTAADWANAQPMRGSGGRRRRDEDSGHDVLARILARESPKH